MWTINHTNNNVLLADIFNFYKTRFVIWVCLSWLHIGLATPLSIFDSKSRCIKECAQMGYYHCVHPWITLTGGQYARPTQLKKIQFNWSILNTVKTSIICLFTWFNTFLRKQWNIIYRPMIIISTINPIIVGYIFQVYWPQWFCVLKYL